jgi:tetratricopeptide (TPR) repeat protein
MMPCHEVYSQKNKEYQLTQAIKNEQHEAKRFMRLMALGRYYKGHNLYKADSIKRVILSQSRPFNDSIRCSALLFSAEIAETEGNQDAYFKDILACQPFLNVIVSEQLQFEIYKHLGYYHSHYLEFIQANLYLRKALDLAKNMRNNSKISESYSYISLNFMLNNQKDSAMYYTDESIQYARRSANKSVLAKGFNTQARIYDYFGQMELSVAKNLISLQLASDMTDLPKMAKYSRELGQSQLAILNLDDAEFYFKKSLEYARLLVDQRQIALALSNLGTVHKERKEYGKAIDYNLNALQFLTVLKDNNGLGEVHSNLGIIYREQGEYEVAASNFNKSLVFFESTSNKEGIAAVYHHVGIVFQKQRKYAIALNYLNKSILIRNQFGAKNQIFNTYRIIADVYGEIGQTKNALKFLQLYLNYVDSNTSIQASTKIAELSELYRSEQRERLISIQADSIERQHQEKILTSTKVENIELRNNLQTYIIFGFIVILILAGIIGFYRLNQTKIKQQRREAEMSQILLRTQMNPHFIFNAMSVIQSYIYANDVKNSSKFLINFSRLMRLILENSPKEFIPMETEAEILQKYLETQKLRFEDRFEFSIDVEDELIFENAMIPPMITQPFIENSIEHGQLHTIEGGFISVQFSKKDNMLQIVLIDNGVGRKKSRQNKKSKVHQSMALKITRDRIENLNHKYKTEGYMIIEDYDKVLESGTKVLISLPYKVESNATKDTQK